MTSKATEGERAAAPPPTPARIDPEALRAFTARAFETAGLPAEDAASVAALMVRADINGADTHGVFRLPLYIRRIRAGGVNARPDIKLLHAHGGAALVDGDNGMGHLVMSYAARTAIDRAKEHGVAWVGARNSNHAGPAALYATMPLEHDMIGLYFAVASSNHLPPWGGAETLLGTNPVAVAVPALEEPPVVMDMSPTVAAYGKVRLKAQRGEAMPVGWMIGADGKPLTDASRADEGFLLPIGDYKGYALSLIIGLLAGTLNGAALGREVIDFVKEDGTAANTGQAICAISIEAFAPARDFKARVDAVVRTLRAAKRLPDVERIWMPGEQTHARRQDRLAQGIPYPDPLRKSLEGVAKELGIAPPQVSR